MHWTALADVRIQKVKIHKGERKMTKEVAEEIYSKMCKCRDRIFDTHYCEDNPCTGCEYQVDPDLEEEALRVLGKL